MNAPLNTAPLTTIRNATAGSATTRSATAGVATPSTLAAFAITLALCTAAPAASPKLAIEQAWTRATAPGAPVAGGFLTLRNPGKQPDRLLSATSPDAERVEIHEMRMDGGMMRMRRIDAGLAIPAGATVALKPGGYHLMFIGPKRRFEPGATVTATLRFERGGERTVRFEVRAMGAGAAHHH